MSPAQIFTIANTLALGGWLLLLFAPESRPARKIVRSGALSLALALGYLIVLVIAVPHLSSEAGFNQLSAVKALFSSDWALLAGWIHYLAFDLLIGLKILEQASGRPRWLISGFLVLTFMFGPVGWLFSKIKFATTRGAA